ncbi:DMT family transporter [Pseudomonas sp. MBLB4123]|uniref:DMT family transporter n=1 Tax=Pseudomonas sp. MBLB4123 TaxID=3451557 RepID=UPI003F74FD03
MSLSLYLLTVLIWGTTWIAIKLQVGEVAVAASIAYRFALAAAVLFAVLLLSGRLQRVDGRGQLICLAQGLCLFCLNFLCFYTASQWIPSGLVAVIFSTATLWNALNARLFFKQRIAAKVLAGGALGLGGLLLLFWPQVADHPASRESLLGIGLALLGTLCFSAGNMLSSLQQKAGLKPLTSNAWGMLYGAVMLAAICLVSGTPFAFEWSTRYVGSLLYLAIPGSVIGFTAYLTLVGRLGPERAAYCTVLFPVVALNISVFAEGYQWSAPALLGLALVMLGNVLVFSKPKPLLPLAQTLGGKAG